MNVEVSTVARPSFWIAPPDVPDGEGDELFEKVKALTDRVPWLSMAPPPCESLLASAPLLSARLLMVSVPDLATSKKRKVGVPLEVERVMVAPLPMTDTLPVITGRPVPPSVELLAPVNVYVQLDASVTVPPPLVLFAVAMADTSSAVVQPIAADECAGKSAAADSATRAPRPSTLDPRSQRKPICRAPRERAGERPFLNMVTVLPLLPRECGSARVIHNQLPPQPASTSLLINNLLSGP